MYYPVEVWNLPHPKYRAVPPFAATSLQWEIDTFNEENQKVDKFVSLVHKYTRFEELTAEIINEFIYKIIIHEAVWSEATETNRRMGTRSQQIDIYLKYIGSFDTPDLRSPKEIEAKRIAEEKLERRRKRQREYARKKAAEKRAEQEQQVVASIANTAPTGETISATQSTA